jgi:hypothetical protein
VLAMSHGDRRRTAEDGIPPVQAGQRWGVRSWLPRGQAPSQVRDVAEPDQSSGSVRKRSWMPSPFPDHRHAVWPTAESVTQAGDVVTKRIRPITTRLNAGVMTPGPALKRSLLYHHDALAVPMLMDSLRARTSRVMR